MATRRQTYTAEQKRHALELYARDGAASAGRATGIPADTIRQWASRAGLSRDKVEKFRAGNEAQRVAWESRRLDFATDLGELAANAARLIGRGQRDAIQGAEASMSTADLKNHAVMLGILVEKAQLLTGAATVRSENMGVDPLARVAKVRDELAARRRGAA